MVPKIRKVPKVPKKIQKGLSAEPGQIPERFRGRSARLWCRVKSDSIKKLPEAFLDTI